MDVTPFTTRLSDPLCWSTRLKLTKLWIKLENKSTKSPKKVSYRQTELTAKSFQSAVVKEGVWFFYLISRVLFGLLTSSNRTMYLNFTRAYNVYNVYFSIIKECWILWAKYELIGFAALKGNSTENRLLCLLYMASSTGLLSINI